MAMRWSNGLELIDSQVHFSFPTMLELCKPVLFRSMTKTPRSRLEWLGNSSRHAEMNAS